MISSTITILLSAEELAVTARDGLLPGMWDRQNILSKVELLIIYAAVEHIVTLLSMPQRQQKPKVRELQYWCDRHLWQRTQP